LETFEGDIFMTKVYFVRHAQPVHSHKDDRTRPLTKEGEVDLILVLNILKDKQIDVFYCSPYKRSLDTIRQVAKYYHMQICTDERLRERECGNNGNASGMIEKRWADFNYHEMGGESIQMVQNRNIQALKEILAKNEGKNIVVGTHGTALSSIMNHYNSLFGCQDFFRIIDWMPYIVEMDFDGQNLIAIREHGHLEKENNEKR
jgi:2,3-bisphosphoglycerate-dependent phosphoglycerate mutase